MVKTLISKSRILMVCAAALIIPSNVSANDIALTFENQSFTLHGAFVRMDADTYIVMTEIGVLNVPGDMVTCTGSACPAESAAKPAKS